MSGKDFQKKGQYCHTERSEASSGPTREILRGVYTECNECAQDDSSCASLRMTLDLRSYCDLICYTIRETLFGSVYFEGNESLFT